MSSSLKIWLISGWSDSSTVMMTGLLNIFFRACITSPNSSPTRHSMLRFFRICGNWRYYFSMAKLRHLLMSLRNLSLFGHCVKENSIIGYGFCSKNLGLSLTIFRSFPYLCHHSVDSWKIALIVDRRRVFPVLLSALTIKADSPFTISYNKSVLSI